jgi:hypothetical protein
MLRADQSNGVVNAACGQPALAQLDPQRFAWFQFEESLLKLGNAQLFIFVHEETVTALNYARDPELHMKRVIDDAALDGEHLKRLYAEANRLLRGGETKRRPGSKRRDMELLLAVIAGEVGGSDEELARKIIGVLPDLGLLPGDFVFNPDDVPRIAPLIAKIKRRHDDPEQTARKIARAVLVDGFGADKAKIDDLFE